MPRFPLLVLAAAAAAALAVAPAGAEEEGPRWVPTLKKALVISKERGSPILVWCSIDDDPSNKADQDVMRKPEVQKAMKGYLVVYGNHQDGHGSKDGAIDGKPAKVCALAPRITCADHKRAIDEVYQGYGEVAVDKASNLRTPIHFVLDPEGKVLGQINNGSLAGGFDSVPVPQMVKGLQTLLVKAGGPGLTDEQIDRFQKALASARTSVEQGRMSEAAKAIQPVLATGKNIAIVRDARDILKRVDKEATAAFAKAQAEMKTNPLSGILALERVAEDYPGTESADMARKAAEAFKGSPEGKKTLKDIAREKEGRGELDKAWEVAESRSDDAKALRLLDGVARKYAGLPAGEDARKRADAIRNDPDRMKAIQAAESEREARTELTTAKGLLDAGKKDEARKALQAIVDSHGGTKAAAEARKLLEGLR